MTGPAEPTLIDELEEHPRDKLELAAARLVVDAAVLLARAKRTSGLTGRELAERLGVSEGRVSQVLGSDGNLRIAALGRYARALGYQFRLTAEPVESDRPSLEPPTTRQRRSAGNKSSTFRGDFSVRASTRTEGRRGAGGPGQNFPVTTIRPIHVGYSSAA